MEIEKTLGPTDTNLRYPDAMSKQPKLTLISPDATGSKPPRPLGVHGMALWRSVQAEYQINDRGGIELLAQACAALDRAEALAAAITEAGEVISTRTGLKAHPAIRDELACRAFICRTLQRLGLNLEIIKSPGRPSGGLGISWEDLQDKD